MFERKFEVSERIHLLKRFTFACGFLTTYDIDDRKNNDPDGIHEMPVPRDHLDVVRDAVSSGDLAGSRTRTNPAASSPLLRDGVQANSE